MKKNNNRNAPVSMKFNNRNALKQTKSNNSKARRILLFFLITTITMSLCTIAAHAAVDDPLKVVANLSDFIFGLIRAIGMIMLGFGVVQIGLSLKSHDPSQRANGLLTAAGGLVITFAKQILDLITGG